ncbi:Flp family type IVb pilin [Microvirga sp. 2YAF29]|uniref:Flp family type IVb pilin n=1 Tax=Microvirga sp. 2YAF29 TaxID=3233031 RepID=UPI003F98162B
MMSLVSRFKKNESGATAIEYGLIAALIAVVIIGAVGFVGDELKTTFTTIQTKLSAANTPAPATTP